MKYKHRVFSKALRILEEEDYSCNALAFVLHLFIPPFGKLPSLSGKMERGFSTH